MSASGDQPGLSDITEGDSPGAKKMVRLSTLSIIVAPRVERTRSGPANAGVPVGPWGLLAQNSHFQALSGRKSSATRAEASRPHCSSPRAAWSTAMELVVALAWTRRYALTSTCAAESSSHRRAFSRTSDRVLQSADREEDDKQNKRAQSIGR